MSNYEDFAPMHVFQGIADARDHLAEKGLPKDQRNDHQKFMFRGIDPLYGILQPALKAGKIVMIPSVEAIERKEYTIPGKPDRDGVIGPDRVQFSTVVKVKYSFVSLVDGSRADFCYPSEASDTGDKGLPKALTQCFKSFCFHVFQIPLNGNDDADKHTPEEVTVKLDEVVKEELEAAALGGVQVFRDYWKGLDKATCKAAKADKKWFDGLRATAEGVGKG